MKYRLRRPPNTTNANTETTDSDPAPGSGNTQSTAILNPLPCPAEGRPPANKTDEAIREAVVQAVMEEGMTITAAAEKFSLHRDTASAILQEYRRETGELENLRLGNKFHKLADRVVDELNKKDLSTASPSQLGVLAGIAVDKKIQLTGKPAAGNGIINMRVAWKDGSGAVELSTGDKD